MTAPAFRQKVQSTATGSSPHAVTFPAASLTGSLLTLAVYSPSTITVTTPSGWTVGLAGTHITDASNGEICTIYYKTGAAETTVNVTLSADTGHTEFEMAEHTGLHSPTVHAAATIRRENAVGPGYGKIPAISYGAVPTAVLAWMFMKGGPQGSDNLAVAGTGATLRTPIAGADTFRHLALSDVLLDTTAGATVLYPGAGGWIFTFTDTLDLMGVGIAFESGTAATTPGVFMDWDGDGFDIGDNDNVTSYVQSWSINRGAGPEIIGGSQPGSCILRLKNTNDRFNPYNASGPLYGKLTDGVPVWIGITDDGKVSGSTANGLFGGRITDITLLPGEGTSAAPVVEIVCEDALGWYRRYIPNPDANSDYAEGRSQGTIREHIIARVENVYDLDLETHTTPVSHFDGSILSGLEAVNAVNGTRHFIKPADLYTDWYTYTTRNRQWRLDGTVDGTLNAASDHVTGTDGWRLSADTVTNHQDATVEPVAFTPATFTVWQEADLPVTVDAAHPYSKTIGFQDYVSHAVLNYAASGAPDSTGLVAFATGAIVSLESAAGITVKQLSIQGRLARRLPSETYTAYNFTSTGVAERHVRAGGEISGEYLGVLANAKGIAEHIVWRYGNPQLRPTITVENWMPYQFQLDLYDTIAFTSTQLGMSGKVFEIVGLTHHGNIAAATVQHHVTEYILQECKVQTPTTWFTWDVSDWDGSDNWPYN